MTIVGTEGFPLPIEPSTWRWRLATWFRSAVDLITLSKGQRATGGGSTTPQQVTNLALEALMLEHAEAAYRVALSVTRNHELAEDVTQESMLKAWQALPTFRGDSPLRNWVLRITHNTAISTLRKRRDVLRDPFEMPEEPAGRTVERQAHGRMALEAFEEALGELDELTRSIVVLREIEALSYDEIAATVAFLASEGGAYITGQNIRLANALEGWRA